MPLPGRCVFSPGFLSDASFCATSRGCLFCLYFWSALAFFLAHSNNAKVNFCLNDDDDEDDEVGGRGNIYLHDWRNVNGCGPTRGTIRWWRRLSNYGAAFYYFLTRAPFHGSSLRSTKPEEVKMLKFPTLLFLFPKIGNPSSGRLLPADLEHFSGTTRLRRCSRATVARFTRRGPSGTGSDGNDDDGLHTQWTSNSRKWSFPHRAPDIKLLTVAIWREGMESFHFTVQILSLTLSVSFCRDFSGGRGSGPGTADCLPFAHNPSRPNFRPLLFYCIQSGWFDGLLTNLLFCVLCF